MTITELGALGEFVGAIAVVATLLFLAIQVWRSARAADADIRALLLEASKEVPLDHPSLWAVI